MGPEVEVRELENVQIKAARWVKALEENPRPLYDKTTLLLLKIVDNIIREPHNPKFRTLRLDNAVVIDKLIPVIGAMECLFEIGFEEAPLLQQMKVHSAGVLQYEDSDLQRRALSLVPLARLAGAVERRMATVRCAVKAGQIAAGLEPDARDILLLELLHWFKGSFFSWVDAPACTACHGPTTFLRQVLHEGVRTEVYECGSCHNSTSFPRYNDASKLLQTRRGRCGEWANCFTLLCRALGWDARLVVDSTDHVWTEVFSTWQGRWLHCDPCEEVCDQPLLYEAGWGKHLNYVLAYSCDDVQDVTWRYSSSWKDVLARRTQCSEQELLQAIFTLRAERQAMLSPARRAFLQRRLVAELIQFLSPVTASAAEQKGRTSGSLAWRLARGEMHEITANTHTWVAGPEQVAALRLTVNYCTARDCYEAGHGSSMPGWQNGVFSMQNMFRKEEHDWGYVYLARTASNVGYCGEVQWLIRLHYGRMGLTSRSRQLKVTSSSFHHVVSCGGDLLLSSDNDTRQGLGVRVQRSVCRWCCRWFFLRSSLGNPGEGGVHCAQALRQCLGSSENLVTLKYAPAATFYAYRRPVNQTTSKHDHIYI
ncbi:hypothetical protein PR048_016588 [Dryococelus australis]|uniref:Peptide-N(4)-(N-acetyl-beta-glucosaminyl)asparagine amidase n=1 Tax=Dryococelus australis TaxID=614101 RepID=A0ABQ9H757_9NEOP|nr:hypothetical protein PR048_016588 [Dryococelus australis]